MPEQTRKLAAIVFTDIVGYTKLTAENEPAALALIKKQRETLKPIVEEYGGSWLKEMGDGLLLTFNTNREAVDCAIAIQNAVKEIDDLLLRIGIHQGEVLIEGNDVVGDDVNIASRIEPFSAGGGIAVSGRVNSSLERDPEFTTKHLGQPELKGVSQTVKIYCITSHGLPKTDLAKVDAKILPEKSSKKFWFVGSAVALLIGFFIYKMVIDPALSELKQSSEKLKWAREEGIPELYQLIQDDNKVDAYELGKEIEEIIPKDSMLVRAFAKITRQVSIYSNPEGADIYRKNFSADDSTYEYLGKTPVEDVRFPWIYSSLKFEKDGFETIEIGAHPYYLNTGENKYMMPPAGTIPDNMVLIPGGATQLNITGLEHLDKIELSSCYMDKYELTNAEYKKFIDDGGYKNEEYWPDKFIYNGKTISFENAMKKFVDGTNMTGPSTWEAGYYPDGQADYPVSGISWFEAKAYAKYVNKSLPSVYHWNRSAGTRSSARIIPKSNFNGKHTVAVGGSSGVSPFGNFDMAGNVREWCENRSEENSRAILGGGYDDETY